VYESQVALWSPITVHVDWIAMIYMWLYLLATIYHLLHTPKYTLKHTSNCPWLTTPSLLDSILPTILFLSKILSISLGYIFPFMLLYAQSRDLLGTSHQKLESKQSVGCGGQHFADSLYWAMCNGQWVVYHMWQIMWSWCWMAISIW